MAFATVVTITKRVDGGRLQYVVDVAETDVAAASESSIEGGFPAEFTIEHFTATLESGTGTVITPQIAKAAGVTATTDDDHIATQRSAAARHNDNTRIRVSEVADGKLYLKSTPDAGTDNVINTRIVLAKGHAA